MGLANTQKVWFRIAGLRSMLFEQAPPYSIDVHSQFGEYWSLEAKGGLGKLPRLLTVSAYMSAMRDNPLFGKLRRGDPRLRAIIDSAEERDYCAGETIMEEGVWGNSMFFC